MSIYFDRILFFQNVASLMKTHYYYTILKIGITKNAEIVIE
jgi:hypothetical protein